MLSKDDILKGLRKLDQKARNEGIIVELALYGGAALVLAFDMRQATRDVDAIFSHPFTVRQWVKEISEEENWPNDWLNDGVKGFVSATESMRDLDEFDGGEQGGLRVTLPTAEYLFAMKCMAMRPEGIDGSHDISDIQMLADVAAIKDAAEAIDLVESFYPAARIPAKVRFGIEEIMDRVTERRRTHRPSV
jgi:hypothetical protein